jgi:ribonuclease Z
LIDAGASMLHRMVEAGYMRGMLGVAATGPRLRRILFTHLHSDHCTGLADILWAGWIQKLFDNQLVISGPPGTIDFVEKLIDAYSYDVHVRTVSDEGLRREDLMPRIEEVEEGWCVESNDLRISAFRVEHEPVDQAFGYRLDGSEGSVVISGDTKLSPNLIEHAQEADLLVHEVISSPAFRRLYSDPNTPAARRQRMDFISGYHTPSQELGRIATDSNARHLVMSHLIMYGGTSEELVADIAPNYKGKTTVGEDLMTFELAK